MKFPPSGVFLERDYSAGKILGAVETNLIISSRMLLPNRATLDALIETL